MSIIDYAIVIIPIFLLMGVAIYSGKYARDVVDFLAAGRIAGRYVLAVGGLEGALSVITLVAGCEANYQTGFSLGFWNAIIAPIGMFIALSGYCVYRWRETRCLSLGHLLELRYGSKFFRVFCAALRTTAELVTNAIGPAVATNFFIYYLGLPHRITFLGVNLPCYAIIVTLCLCLAVLFIWPSGRISLVITDCFQGLVSYPIFVIIVGYILLNFSWWDDLAPVMWNRVPGQSFMNPYDVSQFRDFNLFALVVTICGSILNRASWFGNDTNGAARTAHEQKMSGILGAWKNGFSYMMILLTAIIVIVFMTSPHYTQKSKANKFKVTNVEIRSELSRKVLEEVLHDPEKEARIMQKIDAIPSTLPADHYTHKLSQQRNLDTPYLNIVREELGDTPQGRFEFQKFRSTYQQMMMPSVLRRIFPVGILGLFCLLMVMLLISTDDTRIFNASATLTQDIILPMFKRRISPKFHLALIRGVTFGVALLFLVVSLFFAQLDYINMFTTIMCSLWLGGAGPIMIFGLYSRFGNLTGAWCAIIFGSGTSLIGLICQRNWAQTIYPFIESQRWVESFDIVLKTISAPLEPWVSWSMNPIKFPINSYEIYFISMLLSVGSYIIGSLITYKPYDLDKLLHCGRYADQPAPPRMKWTFRNVFAKLIGISSEYTLGDKIIAYSVFGYSFVYSVVLVFGGIVIWNVFYKWPDQWWTIKFFITSLVVPGIVASISTVWFMWGGIRDSRQLLIDLEKRKADAEDNGQVLSADKEQ